MPPITYAIQPACVGTESKMTKRGSESEQHIDLKSECNTITDVYGVTSFPTAFFVDRNGVIRKIKKDGPPSQHYEPFYEEMKSRIDSMLAE